MDIAIKAIVNICIWALIFALWRKDAADEITLKENFNNDKARFMAEGEAVGKEEGIAECKKKVVRAMLADGIPVDSIRKYTGLSIDEINAPTSTTSTKK